MVTGLRLALIRQRYTPYGGAERFLERALEALRSQGIAITLITRGWDAGAAPADIEIVRCDPFHIGRLWRTWAFNLCARRQAASGRFDLVQSHERIPGCDIYRAGDGIHATWIERLGMVRGPVRRLGLALSPWHRYVLAQERALFADPRLKAVICNSRMVREDIVARFRLDARKLHVIYNGVDLEDFHPGLWARHRAEVRGRLGIGESDLLFIYVGSGYERKGLGPLLDAMAECRGEFGLLVVGRDKAQPRYEARARRLGLAEHVHFLGAQNDVRPYYGAADAAVFPTLYDPFPNVVLEALAVGLPVLTSPGCGAAEVIEQDTNGLVCDPLDRGRLAQGLRRLAQLAASDAARHAARASASRFDVRKTAQDLLALYRSLLPAGVGPAASAHG